MSDLPSSTLVSLQTAFPSLWFVDHARTPRMQAVCSPGADVHEVKVSIRSAAFPSKPWEVIIASLRAEQATVQFPVTIIPEKLGHYRMRLEVDATVPGILTQHWDAEVDMLVRNTPRSSQDLQGMLQGVTMTVGEKALFGQLVSDANVHIGPRIEVNTGGFDAALEAVLSRVDAETLGEMRMIRPIKVTDICHSWTSLTGLELAAIPAGRFRMGASEDDKEADRAVELVREVTLKSCHWMGSKPVTQMQFRQVMGRVPQPSFDSHVGDHLPVTHVSWDEAQEFCERLTQIERASKAMPAGFAYRLPTEAEWEHACRAGSTSARYGVLEEIASVAETMNRFQVPGRLAANAWGLHDMLGLVFEWCQDVYAQYRPTMTVDPVNNFADSGLLNLPVHRVLRGGSYQDSARFARASARIGEVSGKRSGRVGFRVVLGRELASA
jgi:formylglycine-generating enzyme